MSNIELEKEQLGEEVPVSFLYYDGTEKTFLEMCDLLAIEPDSSEGKEIQHYLQSLPPDVKYTNHDFSSNSSNKEVCSVCGEVH